MKDNNIMRYILFNKNEPLIEFVLKENIADYTCIESHRFKENLPIWLNDINAFIEERNYAKHKEHLKKWLKEWGIDNKKGFLESTKALGLNDCLWVKAEDSNLTWEDVSLYTNEFNDIVEKTAFGTGLKGLQLSSTSPEITASGSFEKCWKKEGGEIYIYKKGSSGFANAGLEPYSEYYASQIAKYFDKRAVKYDLQNYKGSLVSKCRIFTSDKFGLVPFYKYFPNEHIDMQKAFDYSKQKGFEDEFRNMIVFDSIIMNPDRHTGNFGFLIDNNTLEIVGFSPLYDYNYSLLCRCMDDDLADLDKYLETQGHKLGGDYLTPAKALLTNDILHKLEDLKNFSFNRLGKINLPEERLRILENQVNKQINILQDYAHKNCIGTMDEVDQEVKRQQLIEKNVVEKQSKQSEQKNLEKNK